MSWPPTLTALKADMANRAEDGGRDDAALQRMLDAAVSFVQRVRPDFGYPGIPDVGDQQRLSLLVTDDQGDPVNTTTVSLAITLPDGTVDSSLSITNPPAETGRYVATFPCTQVGDHNARWTTTGLVAVVPQLFTVRSAAGRKAPTPDLILGTLRLAGRWHTRRRSPDGLVSMAELGAARVPSFDPDIERLLKIGRYRGAVFA